MACGCDTPCSCYLIPSNTVSVPGDGAVGTPWQPSVIPDPTGGIYATINGVAILIDPASPATISTSAAGLSVACCPACVLDSDTIDFSLPGGCISGNVRIDPAGSAPVSSGPAGLKIDCCSAGDVLADPVLIEYTSGDSFEKADYPNLRAVKVLAIGPGSGSGASEGTGAGESSAAGGGGGGGWAEAIIPESALAAIETITIGAGGTAGATPAGTGGAGATSTSFGAHVVAGPATTGGGGSPASALRTAAAGGLGGVGTVGTALGTGDDGGNGMKVDGDGKLWSGHGGGTRLAGMQRTGVGGAQAGIAGNPGGGGASGGGNNAGNAADQPGAAGGDGKIILEVL